MLYIINDAIDGTPYEDALKKWEKYHIVSRVDDELGQVGYKYWLNFKKRNSDKIVSRWGGIFELDWLNWITYHKFH